MEMGTFDGAQEAESYLERAWARMEQNRRRINSIMSENDQAANDRRKAEFFRLRKKFLAGNLVGAYDLPTSSTQNIQAYEPRQDYVMSETSHGAKKKTLQRPPPPPKWSLHLPRGSNETNTLTVCSSWGCLAQAERRCQQKIPGFPRTTGASMIRCWGASCAKHFTFEVSGRTTLRICEACAHKVEDPPQVPDS
jgi:hypothetical protein